MRDFERPGRSEAFGVSGMAATSQPQATLAAIEVLRAGGNAVDAAVAAAALLAVIEPTQTGIGGDCFALLKREGQRIVAINGSGAAPAAESAERHVEGGATELDRESAHAVTIPGAVRTWARLVEDHGTFDWARLLGPAIEAAENGYPVTERLARDWSMQVAKLSRHAVAASIFLPGWEISGSGRLACSRRTRQDPSGHLQSGARCLLRGLDLRGYRLDPPNYGRAAYSGRSCRVPTTVRDAYLVELS